MKINIAGTNTLVFLGSGKFNRFFPTESRFYMIAFEKNRYKNKEKSVGNFNYLVNVKGESFNLTYHVVLNNSVDVDVVLRKQFCFIS